METLKAQQRPLILTQPFCRWSGRLRPRENRDLPKGLELGGGLEPWGRGFLWDYGCRGACL